LPNKPDKKQKENTLISDDQKERIKKEIQPFVAKGIDSWLHGVAKVDLFEAAETHLAPEHVIEKIEIIEKYLPGYLTKDKRILEVGIGFGAFSAYTRKSLSWDVYGLEPDTIALESATKLSKLIENKVFPIVRAEGEFIPYADNTFDFIYSSNVIEHVIDPGSVLKESLRVLKPGGYIFFTFPNYGSWWEGHYGILWLPNMSKWLAKIYVSLFGRDPRYIDTLQFMSVSFVKKLLENSDQIRVLTYGKDMWEARMKSLDFYGGGSSYKLKPILRLFKKIPLIYPTAIFIGGLLEWYYPIILVIQKNP
jgi:SAM-dependent methyltransferase